MEALICWYETEPSSEILLMFDVEGFSPSAGWWVDGQTAESPLNTVVDNMSGNTGVGGRGGVTIRSRT